MTDVHELQELLDSDDYDFRYDCGIMQPTQSIQLTERDHIISCIAKHYAVLRPKAELDQLLAGLCTLSVLDLVRANAQVMRSLFVFKPQPLTADALFDMLPATFCLEGSNTREAEEATFMHLVEYIQMIESEYQLSY